ncbi:MAG: restriction endonuclease subunit S [Methanobrevibacter sp.]|uniref:restriction endonuclease subunit S n=1 Tax=Methanobrevibacter sp. TaxID=66852 RepID=UPI0025EAC9A3|nr:restriction endonuclease subunit S [Methanobrevibacter sp.]MBR6992605.1 restriction endonuclease subunit S [Methanobrevibacter sp.]
MDLENKEWREFVIGEIFDDIVNSKAYHKNNLNTHINNPIPYVTRTKYNNGLESIVENSDLEQNPKNTIVFGAESVTFFYEPFEYITGNKMYYIIDKHFNKHICLFLVNVLNNLVKNNFGYSRGLTGSRLKKQKIMLPINENKLPDYDFMEEYMIKQYNYQLNIIKENLKLKLETLNYKPVPQLDEIKWKEFSLTNIGTIKSGKDITKKDMINGKTPYVSSTANNNGISAYINNNNETLEGHCISINRNGSVGYAFYHPYSALFSNDCRKLTTEHNANKYISLFIVNQIKAQKDKYNYGYKMGTNRLEKQKIMLPIDANGNPNYEYMEQYMINLEINTLTQYKKYIENMYS